MWQNPSDKLSTAPSHGGNIVRSSGFNDVYMHRDFPVVILTMLFNLRVNYSVVILTYTCASTCIVKLMQFGVEF